MSLTRSVAHNTIIQGMGKIAGTVLGALAAFFLLRYLKDEKYGLYTTVMVYLQVFGILMDMGLFIILIKKISQVDNEQEHNKIINNTFTFRLTSGVILLLLAIVVSWFIPQYNDIIRWGILIASVNYLCISLSQVLTAIYQKHLAMTKVAIAEIISKIFLFISTLSVIYVFKAGVLAVFLTVVLCGGINFLYLFWGTRKYYKIKLSFDFKEWRKIFQESWPIALSISLNMLYFKADTLILGWFKSQAEVGIYGAPYKILEVIITLPAMFVGLIMPVLSGYYQAKNLAKFKQVFQKAFDALIMMALPLIAGTIVVAHPLMLLLAGKKFTTNINDLGTVLSILIWAVGIIFIGTLTGYIIVIVDQQKAAIKAYAFVALTALAGYLILIPKYSYFGAAAVTVYSELIMMLFGFYYLYKTTKILPNLKTLAKTAAASLLMFIVLWLLKDYSVWLLIPIGCVVYLVFICLFKALSKQEILEIISIKKNA